MLDRIKSLFGSKTANVAPSPATNMSERPFTQALLLRAEQQTREDVRELRAMVGKIQPVVRPNTLEGRIDSAVGVLTTMIVFEAASRNGVSYVTQSGDSVSPRLILGVAFGFTIINALRGPIRDEGYEVELVRATANLVCVIFILQTDEERANLFEQAKKLFLELMQMDLANVEEWRENNAKLVRFFVLQFTSDDEKLQDVDFLALFGSQFKVLLSTLTT